MRGRRLAVVGIVLLVIVVLAGAWFFIRDDSSAVSPLPPEQARPSADQACSLMRQFESQVIANGQAKIALATIDSAAEAANRASRGDVVWVRLDSGIRAVRAGFRKNDARATRVGIDVVHDVCAEFAPATPIP